MNNTKNEELDNIIIKYNKDTYNIYIAIKLDFQNGNFVFLFYRK